MKKWLKRLALLLASAFIAGSVFLLGKLNGWFLEDRTATELASIIEPHVEVFKPDGDGPFKTVLMFHGCGGDAEQQRYWGGVFKEWGYAAVYVDSYAGRDIDQARALKTVCRGQELYGGERAADVLTALAWVKQQSWASRHDIVLAGWSHGAWTVMDTFALHQQNRSPMGLADTIQADLSVVSKVVLFYPYCGIASNTNEDGWAMHPEVLAIDVANDTIVGQRVCDESLQWIETSGGSVNHIILNGVDHAFDIDAVSNNSNRTVLSPKSAGLKALEQVKPQLQDFLR